MRAVVVDVWKRKCKRKADKCNALATTAAALLRCAQLWRHYNRPCRSYTQELVCIQLSRYAVPC